MPSLHTRFTGRTQNKREKNVYEGEITEITPTEVENPLSGYGKTVSHVVVCLKTVKGTKQLRLDPTIYEAILKEKITVGDVIYIEHQTGAVKVCKSLSSYPHSFSHVGSACWAFRFVRFHLRPRIGDICPSPKR